VPCSIQEESQTNSPAAALRFLLRHNQHRAYVLEIYILEIAVTNARVASLHGLPVGPFPLSTAPVSLRKSRARHEQASAHIYRKSSYFRLKLVSSLQLAAQKPLSE
jgi:hypothetical protein